MANKHDVDVPGNSGLPAWLGTYGNLTTLLLCFFILLFSMSSVDVDKYKDAAGSMSDKMNKTPSDLGLTGKELITNGVSQLTEIEGILTHKASSASSELVNEGEATTPGTTENTTVVVQEQAVPKTKVIAEDIKSYLTTEGIQSEVQVSYNSNYVKLTIEGETLFDVGKADLKPEAQDIMGIIATMVLQKKYQDYSIQIDGHTDNWDINTVQFPSNWYLSAARAIAVGKIFINAYNFSPQIISCTGYGEHDPIADNATPEGRSKNRRVEIKLLFDTDEVVSSDIMT